VCRPLREEALEPDAAFQPVATQHFQVVLVQVGEDFRFIATELETVYYWSSPKKDYLCQATILQIKIY